MNTESWCDHYEAIKYCYDAVTFGADQMNVLIGDTPVPGSVVLWSIQNHTHLTHDIKKKKRMEVKRNVVHAGYLLDDTNGDGACRNPTFSGGSSSQRPAARLPCIALFVNVSDTRLYRRC